MVCHFDKILGRLYLSLPLKPVPASHVFCRLLFYLLILFSSVYCYNIYPDKTAPQRSSLIWVYIVCFFVSFSEKHSNIIMQQTKKQRTFSEHKYCLGKGNPLHS